MNKDGAAFLPIVLICGPDAPAFSRELARTQKTHRLGVLTAPSSDWNSGLEEQLTQGSLVIYRLPAAGVEGDEMIRRLAEIAQEGRVDRILIECPAGTHPAPMALLLRGEEGGNALAGPQLSSVILAASDLTVSSLLTTRWTYRDSPLLLAEQIEFADAVVLTQANSQSPEERGIEVIAALSPRARIFHSSDPALADRLLEPNAPFSYQAAFNVAWADVNNSTAKEALANNGIGRFNYGSDKPFHPERFWKLLHEPLLGVIRAKGLFWLATRLDLAGAINLAGTECRHGPAGAWESDGDARQTLTFLGKDLDHDSLQVKLDSCLLSEKEFSDGAQSWSALPDPFPAWVEEAHDHDCEHHGCSCH